MAKFEIIKKDTNGKTSSYNVECDANTSDELMEHYKVDEAIELKEGEAIVSVTKYDEPDIFERQRRVKEHAAQSGWDFVTGNPAY